ncbi:MAG: sulfatase-like hydrolase/transferase [Acidobacteriota bacterium]
MSRLKMSGLLVLALVGVGLGLWSWRLHNQYSRERWNLVLVSVDTLRADHLSSYGSRLVRTPHMDRLAADGVLFEQVQTVAPTTLPAHASLFTGRTPLHHRVHDNVGFYLPKDVPTVASLLREEGYRTAGFVGAFVLDSRFGIARGFESYFDQFDSAEEGLAGGYVSQRRGDMVLDRALQWLESHHQGESGREPFFAFLHFYDPHTPYQPPDSFVVGEPTPRTLYRGEVAYVDTLMGGLLNWLEEHDLLERTVLVLTADHGESLGEHGEKTHGFFLYESTLRVPLIIRYPGGPRGVRLEEPVRIIDVAPTVVELLGLSPLEGVDGRSLLPLLEVPGSPPGESEEDLVAYAETYVPRLHYGWSELRSLRQGKHKFILAPRSELYNLDVDPDESRNLVADEPARARQMREELESRLVGSVVPRPEHLDVPTEATLRSLGYVAGGKTVDAAVSFQELTDPKDRISVYEKINDPTLSSVEPPDGKRFESALATLDAVLEEDASIPRAYLLKGELLLKAGRAAAAAATFELLLRLQPDSFTGHYGLAVSRMAMGEMDEAKGHLQRAMEIEPLNTKSYYRLAELEKARSRLAAAEGWLRKALGVHPDRFLQEELAEILLAGGRNSEAEAILSELTETYGTDAAAAYNLGQTRLMRGDAEGAVEHLRLAARLSPQDADVHHALGNALAAAGHRQKALAEYQKAIDLSPCFARAHSNRGAVLMQMGRLDEALASYQRAIGCDPDYPLAYENLAASLVQKGELNRAIEVLERAVRLQPEDRELKATLEELRKRR